MKKRYFFIPVLMVFSLTGCMAKIASILQPKGSSGSSSMNSSQNNNTSSGSNNSSGSTSSSGSSSSSSSSSSELPADVIQYYSSIDDELTGKSLLAALNTLNKNKRIRTMGYGKHRNYFKYTEIIPGNTPSGKMYGFYNSALVSNTWDNQETWNHEHMWPNSRGAGDKGSLSTPYIEDDIHMVRPTSVSINSSRGNKFFGTSSSTYDPGQYEAAYRGVAARIIFYCAIADTRLTLVDKDTDDKTNSTMGKLSLLLQWNLQYAPSSKSDAGTALLVEQNRNNVIYSRSDLQGNRNPFIDHPEYACKIWGNETAATKSACGYN